MHHGETVWKSRRSLKAEMTHGHTLFIPAERKVAHQIDTCACNWHHGAEVGPQPGERMKKGSLLPSDNDQTTKPVIGT